jgi:hypothetical protein
MTYKDNTPTYNSGNRNVANFNDFCDKCEDSKLKSIKRSTKPNSPDEQQFIGNKKMKFNPATRKWDDLSPDMVDDKIDAIEIKEHLDGQYAIFDSFNKANAELNLLEKRLFWGAERYKELEILANQINELNANFKSIKDSYDTFEANILSKDEE